MAALNQDPRLLIASSASIRSHFEVGGADYIFAISPTADERHEDISKLFAETGQVGAAFTADHSTTHDNPVTGYLWGIGACIRAHGISPGTKVIVYCPSGLRYAPAAAFFIHTVFEKAARGYSMWHENVPEDEVREIHQKFLDRLGLPTFGTEHTAKAIDDLLCLGGIYQQLHEVSVHGVKASLTKVQSA